MGSIYKSWKEKVIEKSSYYWRYGQSGSYLAEFLLDKSYEYRIKRRASSFNTQRIDHIFQDPHILDAQFKLHYGDLTDTSNLT